MPSAVGHRRRAPAFVEYIENARCRRRGEWRLAIPLFGITELLAIDVRDREMRQREIAQVPVALHRLARRNDAHAKKRDLESVTMPAVGAQMPGVVPPFRAVLVMRAVVARKLELVAGKGGREVGKQKAEDRKECE